MQARKAVKSLRKFVCIFILLFFFSVPVFADTVSMSFSNVPVGYLFQNLGKLYGVSFSISAAAAGKMVSVELTDVGFEEALEMIASSAGVTITKKAEGLFIVRADGEETEGVSQEEKKRKEQETRLKGAVMDTITTKFVGAKDVQKALEDIFGDEFKSLISVSELAGDDEDEKNYNSVVVYASSNEILNTVKDVIAKIDRPKPMVEMQALFVELTYNENKDLGTDWNVMTNPLKFQEEAPDQNPENDPMRYYTSRFGQFWRISPWEAEAMITALHGTGHGRVLANPKVRVMSGRRAAFVSETQMPILTKDGDGEINTEWKNVGISLEILPTVLDDGVIYMKVIPRASSIIGEKRLGEVSAPIISERRVETEMLLDPDETIVIGGLINDRDIKNMSKVPVLGDIPLFGELFRNTKTETERSTVIVFLRPTIVENYSNSGLPESLKKEYEKTTIEIKPVQEKEIKELFEDENIPKEQEKADLEENATEEQEETDVEESEIVPEVEDLEKPKPKRSDKEYEEKWGSLVKEYFSKDEDVEEASEVTQENPDEESEKAGESKQDEEPEIWVPPLK